VFFVGGRRTFRSGSTLFIIHCSTVLLASKRGLPPLNRQQDLNLICNYLARNP